MVANLIFIACRLFLSSILIVHVHVFHLLLSTSIAPAVLYPTCDAMLLLIYFAQNVLSILTPMGAVKREHREKIAVNAILLAIQPMPSTRLQAVNANVSLQLLVDYMTTSDSAIVIVAELLEHPAILINHSEAYKHRHVTELTAWTCINFKLLLVTSFSVAVAVDKKAKILCGQLSNRCTTCRRFD